MPVDQKNIESYLEGAARAERFDPYWLVTGNDEFLMLETGDKIRAAAFVAGHTERIVLELGAKSDWTTLVEAVTSYGMFDDKKIVEVRLAGAPGLKGGPVLKDLLSRIYDGVSVVFFVPTPDWSSAKAAWWTELKKQSTVVECNTPERRNLPAWLGARLARHGQSASPDTLEAFSDLVEGNLFAARILQCPQLDHTAQTRYRFQRLAAIIDLQQFIVQITKHLFPFLFVIYPYTTATEKQKQAMDLAHIKYVNYSIYEITVSFISKIIRRK